MERKFAVDPVPGNERAVDDVGNREQLDVTVDNYNKNYINCLVSHGPAPIGLKRAQAVATGHDYLQDVTTDHSIGVAPFSVSQAGWLVNTWKSALSRGSSNSPCHSLLGGPSRLLCRHCVWGVAGAPSTWHTGGAQECRVDSETEEALPRYALRHLTLLQRHAFYVLYTRKPTH